MYQAIIVTDRITLKGVYIFQEDDDRIWVSDELRSSEWIGVPRSEIKAVTKVESDATSLSQISCSGCGYDYLAMHDPTYKGGFYCPKCDRLNQSNQEWCDRFRADEFSEFRNGVKIRKI